MSRFSHQHHHHHRRRFDAWHVAASRSRRPDPARAAPRRTAGRGALTRPGPPAAAARALASSASPWRVSWPFCRPWRLSSPSPRHSLAVALFSRRCVLFRRLLFFSHHHHHHRHRPRAGHAALPRARRADPARAAPRRTAGRGALARPGPPTAATRALASSASPMRVPWPFFLPGPFPRPWRGPWRVLPILSRFPIWSRARRAAPPAPRTTPAAAPPLRPPPARTPHPGPLRPPPQGKNRANAAAQEARTGPKKNRHAARWLRASGRPVAAGAGPRRGGAACVPAAPGLPPALRWRPARRFFFVPVLAGAGALSRFLLGGGRLRGPRGRARGGLRGACGGRCAGGGGGGPARIVVFSPLYIPRVCLLLPVVIRFLPS